ncbi:MAG: NADH-ubiquinone oxidoreductase-F iron-sulfur binding region domain-containing protein [Candidatus Hadarchaeales archaeon]
MKLKSPADLSRWREELLRGRDPNRPLLTICTKSACGLAAGSDKVLAALEEEIESRGLVGRIEVKETGCNGFCQREPVVTVYPDETFYVSVRPSDVREIVDAVVSGGVVDRLLYQDPVTGQRIRKASDLPFYRHQQKLLLSLNGRIDPTRIEDYIAEGGYRALAKALFELTPEQVLEEVKRSGLRGRGGGGFPTGRKWETTRKAPGEPKYVIVNCDEGDPGAFMDRSLMEGNPHSVLEGLIIGAYAIGSHQGFIYVREEYPLAVENIGIAIEQARECGLLGEDILGSGFDFEVEVHRGAGAFVSGESSALMTAIEGRVGEPRPKYIHTAVKGIHDKPSCLNNVETWANVPLIILNGAEWFRKIGTEGSPGTKIFSLVGKVNNTGLVEVPMGITLRKIIFEIGGGIKGGKRFKAVQTGGPSGGVIPEQYLDTPVDFDELTKLGSMMGSGGMIVMDEDTCMVDVARFFIHFLLEESCGKCIPCREGLRVLDRILTDLCLGRGKEEDLKTIEEICEAMAEASLCALGTTAVNPVLTTMRYFGEEYEAHLKGRCPAKVCKALTAYFINPDKCQGCLVCFKNCPTGAIQGEREMVHVIEQEKCIKCGICYAVCPFGAVEKLSPPVAPPATYGIKAKKEVRK